MIFLILKNFLEFIWIHFHFKSLKKGQNGGFYRPGPTQMWGGTQGHLAEPHEPTRALGGADVAQTRDSAMRVHADTRVVPRGGVRGLRVMGPRVSGPKWEYWAVTQMRYATPPYIPVISLYFYLCGTMFPFFVFILGDVALFKTSDLMI